MISIEWNQVVPLLALVGFLSAATIIYVRQKLDGVFARSSELVDMRDDMEGRMEAMERRLANMPDHADVRALGTRMSNVESSVAVLGAEIRGLTVGIGRIEHMVDLLVKHQMEAEK